MALLLNELKSLKMYKAIKFFYPFDMKNRMKGSIVYLLTPNIQSSINIMSSDITKLNRMAFKSYFMEKNVNLIINNKLHEAAKYSINEEVMPYDKTMMESLDIYNDDMTLNEDYLGYNNIRSFFPDTVDEILNEASVKTKYGVYNFDALFKKILYNQRMKSQKDIMGFYENIKKQIPSIKYTFVDYRLYKGKNLYYDWSF